MGERNYSCMEDYLVDRLEELIIKHMHGEETYEDLVDYHATLVHYIAREARPNREIVDKLTRLKDSYERCMLHKKELDKKGW